MNREYTIEQAIDGTTPPLKIGGAFDQLMTQWLLGQISKEDFDAKAAVLFSGGIVPQSQFIGQVADYERSLDTN
ncbi:MAG: hypothetical protein FWE31_02205 [Firmicutes bacterium]|nr:hypothetical protein [Bacillota bacterium]